MRLDAFLFPLAVLTEVLSPRFPQSSAGWAELDPSGPQPSAQVSSPCPSSPRAPKSPSQSTCALEQGSLSPCLISSFLAAVATSSLTLQSASLWHPKASLDTSENWSITPLVSLALNLPFFSCTYSTQCLCGAEVPFSSCFL